jgi:hypothetical protein
VSRPDSCSASGGRRSPPQRFVWHSIASVAAGSRSAAVAAGDGSWVAAGGILGLSARRSVRRWCVIQRGSACLLLHAPAPVVGVVVWFTLVVRLFLGGIWCGGRGDLDAWRTSSLAPLLAEVWGLLQSLVGHGQRWWWGVDGAIGKQVVVVDTDVAWVRSAWSPVAAALVGRGHRRQSVEWRRGFV